ncbi:MAG TPA: Trm112 family protein [Longimicrobium sp.]|jgi:uncharacterized protein YbaR (Trm112 family)|uniref:Trm112 family protein n=1 Tax=Longimicrobium sp. TaxID=2029185 RepID=UPI002EDA2F80
MFILLTDVLTCPRCGPEFGLILLADQMGERRVIQGRLGCPNCREAYAIRDGVVHAIPAAEPSSADAGASADAGTPADAPASADAESPADADAAAGDDAEAPVRYAALMGLSGATGLVLVAGPGARHAAAVAALVPGIEVVAVDDPHPAPAMENGVSRVVAGGRLPFRDDKMRGAALTGGAAGERLREALRVLAPGARLVVDPAPADTAERLRALGAEVLLEQAGVVVARAPGRPVPLGRRPPG